MVVPPLQLFQICGRGMPELVVSSVTVPAAGFSGQPQGHRIHTTVDFIEEAGKTRLKVHQVYTGFAEKLAGEEGWKSTLENLAETLAST